MPACLILHRNRLLLFSGLLMTPGRGSFTNDTQIQSNLWPEWPTRTGHSYALRYTSGRREIRANSVEEPGNVSAPHGEARGDLARHRLLRHPRGGDDPFAHSQTSCQ